MELKKQYQVPDKFMSFWNASDELHWPWKHSDIQIVSCSTLESDTGPYHVWELKIPGEKGEYFDGASQAADASLNLRHLLSILN